MKSSDIPDELVLNYLYEHQGRWTMLFGREFSTWVGNDLVKNDIFPIGMPEKLAPAKMKQLHKRKLISGCTCGCRGDFEITDKGLEFLNKPRIRKYFG